MLRLRKYIRPYLGYIILMLLLLLGQSAVDLNLPNLMSDIVNVGIQQGGIEETAPEVIPEDELELMMQFMTPEEQEIMTDSYEKVTEADGEILKQWPKALEFHAFKRKALEKDELEVLEKAVSRASYARMSYAKGEQTPENLEKCKKEAAVMPEMMLEQVAPVLTKGFYEKMGADMASLQNRYIFTVGGKMLLMTLLLAAFAISVGFCGSRLGSVVAKDLRREVFRRVTDFTTNEFDQFGTASLITRSTNDIMQYRSFLTMGLKAVFYAPIIGVGGIIMALQKSPGMAWIIGLAGVLIFMIMIVLFAVAVPRFNLMQKLVDKLNLVSRENLSGMMVIRAFATQEFEENRFDQANQELTRNNLFVFRAMAAMMPVMTLVMNGVSLLIVWVGGHQIAQSAIQVGDMMAFIQYTMQIIMSFLMICMIFVMVPRSAVSANRIADVLECKSSIQDDPEPEHLPGRAKGVVEFHDVSFRYEGADENVLEHISFTARPGETTALIGATGSGKSTVVNLIPRFFDVTEGKITLDGVDIRKLPRKELREAIGYVPQNSILFSGTIASNLRYGDENATEAELENAAETAQATEFISKLPKGMDSEISQGGTNVSGGQRQRLSIARALAKKAPVCIFDDSFSALDFKTDAKLRQALKTQTEDKTVLIVAQRISTIMNAEQIIVLDQGKIVGTGTHKELLQNCRTYREIAESQLSKEEL